jgi:hypothetical protein
MKKYYLAFLIIHATASCFSQSEKDSILIKTHFQKKVMPGERDINGYLACWERRPYNSLVSAGNGKYLIDPDVIFNPSVTSIGVVDFRYTNFKFSIHSNTAWVKHDEVSISKMEKDQRK